MQLPRYTQPTTTTRRTTTTTRIQRNPSCLDDNTAYYGNNLKFENNYSSSEDCRGRCDRYPGCNFWSFMKSNGRCFIKSSKVLKFTYFAFVWRLDAARNAGCNPNILFHYSNIASLEWGRETVCSLRFCKTRQQSGVPVRIQRMSACKLSTLIILALTAIWIWN